MSSLPTTGSVCSFIPDSYSCSYSLFCRTLPSLLLLLSACAAPPVIAKSTVPRVGGHLYITRAFQLIPEPDRFIHGVMMAFTEELVLAGYDFTGTTREPKNEEQLLVHLARLNRKVPGTVGIHLQFADTPVGFTHSYFPIQCTVYDPEGQLLLIGALDAPERPPLFERLKESYQPDVAGRAWGKQTWQQNLSFFFPRREF